MSQSDRYHYQRTYDSTNFYDQNGQWPNEYGQNQYSFPANAGYYHGGYPIDNGYGYYAQTQIHLPMENVTTYPNAVLQSNNYFPRSTNRGRYPRPYSGYRGRGGRIDNRRTRGHQDCNKEEIQEPNPQDLTEDVEGAAVGKDESLNIANFCDDLEENIEAYEADEGQPKTADSDVENHRETLAKQLFAGTYECMICCNNIRRQVAVWSCDSCFHLFHLFCIKKWSQSMKIGDAPISPIAAELARNGHKVWRCPACQKEHTSPNFRYMCFCGKSKDPEFSVQVTPHSCGELCGKSHGDHCIHNCTLLCHPGPCPPCEAFIERFCLCGAISATSKCMTSTPLQCEAKCEKTRNCGQHPCNMVCHKPPCPPCAETVEVFCHCGAVSRSSECGSAEAGVGAFSCQSRCGRSLACGEHQCRLVCHPGPCPPCQRAPEVVVTCPCGRVPLGDLEGALRRRCTDPVPVCASGAACGREQLCGHSCPEPCHDGDCPPCSQKRSVSCRCGKSSKEVACADWAPSVAGEFLCQRRCRKKRTCGRCRCGDVCCIDFDHACITPCGKSLSCGQHTCERTCHLGRCPPCTRVNFSELHCECGAAVLPPPVPCGTPRPECRQMCSREHQCEHPVRHTCHADASCPPCTFLVSKRCLGGHTVRHNIPCFQRSVTCGQACGLLIEACGHHCNRACHEGPCVPPEGQPGGCSQPCPSTRSDCGHPCSAPCHVGKPCPGGQCNFQVVVHCGCGLRKKSFSCHSLMTMNKWELWGTLQSSQSSNASIDVEQLSKKTRQLECDSLCSQVERNRAFAEALNISDADPMPTLGAPNYSRFLREFARSNFDFANNVEKNLDELMRTAKDSKHKSRSHSFAPMNRDKRRFVHELAEFYLCETQSYDAEPNRSVVVTGKKDRCRIPTVRLSSIVQDDIREDAKLSGRVLPSAQVIRPVAGILVSSPASVSNSSAPTPTSTPGGSGLQLLGRVPPSSKADIDYFAD